MFRLNQSADTKGAPLKKVDHDLSLCFGACFGFRVPEDYAAYRTKYPVLYDV